MANNSVVSAKPERKFVAPQSGQIVFSALTFPERLSFMGNTFWGIKNALTQIFGEFPITLDSSHLPQIKAMAAASGEGNAAYNQIAEALEKHGGLSLAMEKSNSN